MADTRNRKPVVPLGRLMVTPGVLKAVPKPQLFTASQRHMCGDWGGVCEEDWKKNDRALKHGGRLLSSYRAENGMKFWIVTEWDRSYTTILLPSEY